MARAAVLRAVGDRELDLREDIWPVDPGPDEVRVRIRATGVCHSDLSTMSGALPTAIPAVLGHEGAGKVLAVGDRVTEVAPGDHVIINWTPDCGACPDCHRGEPNLCTTYLGRSFNRPRFRQGSADPEIFAMAGVGTWAEETTIARQGVIKIADDVPFEYAALLGCGLPTGLGAVFNTARVRPGSTVAVIGAGGVGLSVIQGARIAGAATILAVDPLTAKHRLAEKLGATHTATLDDLEAVKADLAPAGFDYAFEVAGRSGAIAAAYGLARRGGEVIAVGITPAAETLELNPFQLVFEAKTIRGCWYGGTNLRRDLPRFIDLWRTGRLDIEGLITRRIGFEDLNDAVHTLDRGEAVRQVVLFE